MLSRLSGGTKKYMLIEIEELIWVNVSARRTQSLRSCPMPELGQKRKWPRLNGMFAVGTRVTSRPPHRSVRAQFGHTAPTLGV
jgi:hypothetical protein